MIKDKKQLEEKQTRLKDEKRAVKAKRQAEYKERARRFSKKKEYTDDEIDAKVNHAEEVAEIEDAAGNQVDPERIELQEDENLGNVDEISIAEREAELLRQEALAMEAERRREIMLATDEIASYKFKNKAILTQALMHASYTKKKLDNNERLEFLGDRVVGLVVAEMLYGRFTNESEGQLSVRQSSLVSTSAMCRLAQEFHLEDLLNISMQEKRRGGIRNKNILADAAEAMLGAMYLDGGFEPVKKVIERHIRPFMEAQKEPQKDFKTRLQEYSQKTDKTFPVYTLISREGLPHEPTFTIGAEVLGIKVVARGGSQKDAQQEAARQLLEILGVEAEKK